MASARDRLPEGMAIRPMTRREVHTLVDWAREEGWNPGLSDADIFWQTDPRGFVAAELDGELIGGGAVIAYGQAYGFMGLFIVRPAFRGRGLGRALWTARRDMLRARLAPDAPIEMDGVEAMEPFYAAGGFRTTHVDRRFAFTARPSAVPSGVVLASDVPFDDLVAFDRRFFPGPRPVFLRAWLDQPGAHARVALGDAGIRAFGVARPCVEGWKIGPLFAEDPEAADAVLRALAGEVPGESMSLDVPDANPSGRVLVARHGMEEVFRCARMVLGDAPNADVAGVFGITTFELG